jgi:hypothetical protein
LTADLVRIDAQDEIGAVTKPSGYLGDVDTAVGGLIATSREEGRCLLTAVDSLLDRWPSERLLELRASLATMLR